MMEDRPRDSDIRSQFFVVFHLMPKRGSAQSGQLAGNHTESSMRGKYLGFGTKIGKGTSLSNLYGKRPGV